MKNLAKTVPTEHAEQVALIQWYNRTHGDGLLFAIPNGGMRNKVTAVKLKLEGVRAGVPDLMLAKPSNGFHGLFIELKRTNGGVVSKLQKDMLNQLNLQGYKAVVCKGFLEAKEVIECYLR